MAKPKTVLTGKEKPADPMTDFLGERVWKSIARQQAIDTLTFMVNKQATTLSPSQIRVLVDGVLGTIGPAYEAAIRDAVLRFIAVTTGNDDVLEPLTEPWFQHIDAALVVRFLWRQIDTEAYEEARRAAGH